MLCRLGQVPNNSVFTHFTHWVELTQAVLRVNTKPFRKSQVEMRNRAVKTRSKVVEVRNGKKTLLVTVQFLHKWSAVSLHLPLIYEFLNFFLLIPSHLMNFFNKKFLLWEIFLIFCLYKSLLCRRAIEHFDVHSWWVALVHFLSKVGTTRPLREEMDGNVFVSRQSLYFFIFHFVWYIWNTFLHLILDLAYKQLCSSPKKRYE